MRCTIAIIAAVLGSAAALGTAPASLVAAILLDLPPYRMREGTAGLEADVLRKALPGHPVQFMAMSTTDVYEAISKGAADMAVSVHREWEGHPSAGPFFSQPFSRYQNFAFTKSSTGVESVADLAGLEVYTWGTASGDLGPEFQALFGPGGSHTDDYRPFNNQTEQVQACWETATGACIIDQTVFSVLSERLGHPDPIKSGIFQRWTIFGGPTAFLVAFADEDLRDRFDRGLAQLCATGGYDDLLTNYPALGSDAAERLSVCPSRSTDQVTNPSDLGS